MKKSLFLLLFYFSRSCFSQESLSAVDHSFAIVAFWNVENLYDTLNDKWKSDEEFTPDGALHWTGKKYHQKIDHLAQVISQMGTDICPDGPAIMGFCEIENKAVMFDLVNSPTLKPRNYHVIHIEGPDARGVDPSFIYNPSFFKINNAVSYRIKLVTDSTHKTRDVLLVSGLFEGEPTAILVNHWPSRRGGELQSRVNRNAAAKVVRHITDSITKNSPDCKILIMGDFNDDPINESVRKIIGTYGDAGNRQEGKYFNPMEKLFKQGIGTLAYQDSWNLFDQILINDHWLNGKGWQYHKAVINNKDFLRNDYGNYKGYPFRTYSGPTYTGGYSDHFASYLILSKKKKSDDEK